MFWPQGLQVFVCDFAWMVTSEESEWKSATAEGPPSMEIGLKHHVHSLIPKEMSTFWQCAAILSSGAGENVKLKANTFGGENWYVPST